MPAARAMDDLASMLIDSARERAGGPGRPQAAQQAGQRGCAAAASGVEQAARGAAMQ
jgi:hypothetical protein